MASTNDRSARPLPQRMLPETIGIRLVFTAIMLVLVTSAVTITVNAWLVLSHVPEDIVVLGSMLAGLGAVIVGVAMALWLNRAVRSPVIHLVNRVKTEGYLVAEGAPYTPQDSGAEAYLPIELRELGDVIDDLLQHLSQRQSELKQAILDAQFAEETLGSVVSESLEAKIVLQDGRIIIANPAASVALARPASVVLGRELDQAFEGIAICEEDGTPLDPLSLLDRALEGSVLASLTREGMPERWFVFQAFPHSDDLHNRVVISARDTTEERRLESLRGEVVSLVSHDLKTPLSVVIGYLDVMRRPLSDEDRDRAITGAKSNAEKMADLIEDLLSATRAEELLAPAELIPIPILTVATEVVSSMAALRGERQPIIDADCDPVVLGEHKRLRQVLVNLISNAYKYSPDTEPITVGVRCDAEHVFLSVIDHGPGIPEEDRARVFKRLERLDSAGQRPGMGLGLYIVSIVADNHGGVARIEETPGGGATFIVELPLAGHVVDGEIVLAHDTEH